MRGFSINETTRSTRESNFISYLRYDRDLRVAAFDAGNRFSIRLASPFRSSPVVWRGRSELVLPTGSINR